MSSLGWSFKRRISLGIWELNSVRPVWFWKNSLSFFKHTLLLPHSSLTKKEKKGKKKRKNERKKILKDLKLFYSQAHSTSPSFIPPPSAFERKERELPKHCYGFKSRNFKNLNRLSAFYKSAGQTVNTKADQKLSLLFCCLLYCRDKKAMFAHTFPHVCTLQARAAGKYSGAEWNAVVSSHQNILVQSSQILFHSCW